MSISSHLELQQNWRQGRCMVVRLQYPGDRSVPVAVKSVCGDLLIGIVVNQSFECLLLNIESLGRDWVIGPGNELGPTAFSLAHVEASNHLYLNFHAFDPLMRSQLVG